MSGFKESFSDAFAHVFPELKGADVFVDELWSDILHWNVAPSELLKARPACILELHTTRSPLPRTKAAVEDARRAVFFIGSFLHIYKDSCCRILGLRTESGMPYKECVVYSAISSLGHARCSGSVQSQYQGKDVCTWFKDTLYSAIGRLEDGREPVVAVENLPVSFACFARDTFFLPLPGFRPCFCFYGEGPLNDTRKVDGGGLMNDLADKLSSLLTSLHVSPDVWSVGVSAKALGEKLTFSSGAKEESVRVPVVIIDRTLDIVPCSKSGMSALEVITTTLEPRGSCDVIVPLDAVFEERIDERTLVGSLAHVDDPGSKFSFDPSFTKPFLNFASNQISKMKREFPEILLKKNMSAEEVSRCLKAVLHACGEKRISENPLLVDWSCAVERAAFMMNSPTIMYENVMSIQKLLIQQVSTSSGDITDSVVSYLSKPYEVGSGGGAERLLPLNIVLVILAMLYSLLGPEAKDRINREKLQKFLMDFAKDSSISPEQAHTVIEPAFSLFDKLATSRTLCRSLGFPLVSKQTNNYSGVTEAILSSIFEPDVSQHEALVNCNSGSGKIPSGSKVGSFLGAFGLAKAPQTKVTTIHDMITANSGQIIIVFLGGVSVQDVLTVRDLCSKYRIKYPYIISTALLTRTSLSEILFPEIHELDASQH